ncbi:MAG: SPOR domain-containing protein [Sulfuricurvum sp.]|nr:SPOR domain-containing protein [Sulfuricurvum sp.]
MKRIILVAFTLALLTSGCKVFKSSKKSQAPQTETSAETKVFSVPAPKSTVRENPVSDTMYETADKPATGTPVSMRSEKFTMNSEDMAAYGNKKYYVIVGSFSSNENAGKFKQELIQQGFKPIILHSETGYFRLCVDSFNDEAAARSRVQNIRTQYPKYADSWLLYDKK